MFLGTGQWGIAMGRCGEDDLCGRLGSERPAHNFQVSPLYADVELPGAVAEKLLKRFFFPIEYLTDAEGGLPRLRPGRRHQSLHRVAGGGSIYRGDALPKDLYGQYILARGPSVRLIRPREGARESNGKVTIENVYGNKKGVDRVDGIRNFPPDLGRPPAPTGAIYIVDMYHGHYSGGETGRRRGTYLRAADSEVWLG